MVNGVGGKCVHICIYINEYLCRSTKLRKCHKNLQTQQNDCDVGGSCCLCVCAPSRGYTLLHSQWILPFLTLTTPSNDSIINKPYINTTNMFVFSQLRAGQCAKSTVTNWSLVCCFYSIRKHLIRRSYVLDNKCTKILTFKLWRFHWREEKQLYLCKYKWHHL